MKWRIIRSLGHPVPTHFRHDKTIYLSQNGRFYVGAVGEPIGWRGEKQQWELVNAKTGDPHGRFTSAKKAKAHAEIL